MSTERRWTDISLDDDVVEKMLVAGMAEEATIVRGTPLLDEALRLYAESIGVVLPLPKEVVTIDFTTTECMWIGEALRHMASNESPATADRRDLFRSLAARIHPEGEPKDL